MTRRLGFCATATAIALLGAGGALAQTAEVPAAAGMGAPPDLALEFNGAVPLLTAACLPGERIALQGVDNIDGQLRLGTGDSTFGQTCMDVAVRVEGGEATLQAMCMNIAGALVETSLPLAGTPALAQVIAACGSDTAQQTDQDTAQAIAPGAGGEIVPNANGDVHISTPDGLHYDFQDTGDFILAQSTDEGRSFRVHARQETWERNPLASVNTRAALFVGGDVVEFQAIPGARMLVNGTSADLPTGPVGLPLGGRIDLTFGQGTDYTVSWPGRGPGARVVVRAGTHIDVGAVRLSGLEFEGLLGDNDGDPANDLRPRGAEAIPVPGNAAEIQRHGDSWRVPAGESLFVTPLPEPEPPVAVPVETANAMQQTAVRDCDAAGIADPVAKENCVYDVAMTGESAFVESAVALDQALAQNPLPGQVGGDEQHRTLLEQARTGAGAPSAPAGTGALKPFSPILAYSIGGQVRGEADNVPDYYLGAANGTVVIGEAPTPFQIARTDTDGDVGGAIVVLRAFAGEGMGRYVAANPDGSTIAPMVGDTGVKFLVRPPLEANAGADFFSLESVDFPGQFLRHSGYVLTLDPIGQDSPDMDRRDATFAAPGRN